MSIRDLSIQASYETLCDDDPVSSFYIPVLSESVAYDRIAGFFSSASLALAARGIAGLIANGGKMRLLVSPNLSEADIDSIRHSDQVDAFIEDRMSSLLSDPAALADEIERDHIKALGWMLSLGMLELRVAVILDEQGNVTQNLLHQKVGIMTDSEGDAVSFSGSINETASAWLFNSEEFKVFKSWELGQSDFFFSDKEKFDELWNGDRRNIHTFKPSGGLCDRLVATGRGFDIEHSSLRRYKRSRSVNRISLFPYQKSAKEAWKKNNGRLLFEMATGTGKTRTALSCLQELLINLDRLVCVIATPQSTLSRQWEHELDNLNLRTDHVVFADSSAGTSEGWAAEIRRCLGRIAIGRSNTLAIITTHASASSFRMIEAIESIPSSIGVCLIGDEVHGMGAKKQRQALLERYDYRIGLSATPRRWFDDEGSSLIRSYFGNASFEFTIRDAQDTINPLTGETFLCPYEYHLEYSTLDDDEAERYYELTKRITRYANSSDPDAQERLEQLLRDRAEIKKDAEMKLTRFSALLKWIDPNGMIVFTSPKRIDEVESLLARHRIAAHRLTQREGTKKQDKYEGLSEREYLIRAFKEGDIQTLVAIKCLDEGIDIPEATTAVLLSSSTNPREYVQRVGRVIRRHPGKKLAHIYDFVVEPDWKRISECGDIQFERRLFEQELRRIEDMRANATNSTDLLIEVRDRLGRAYGNQ